MKRRAVVLERFGPPGVMRLEEQELREPRDEEVLVAVDAIGVNFADAMVRRGEYRRRQPLSFTPGFEVAGKVLATGPGAAIAPGTSVVVFTEYGGGYADHVLAPEARVYEAPPDIAPVDLAGLFVQGVTAWYAVHRYGCVQPGEWVLIHAAAGGVGGLAVQLTGLVGGRSIGTASTEPKLAVAAEHGADATVLATPEAIRAEVPALTGGAGANVVIDGVGGPLFAPSLDVLANGGRYVVAGAASQEPSTFDARRLMPRAQTVCGFIVARVADQSPEEPKAALWKLCELLRGGKLKLDLTLMPFEEVERAHEQIESRRQTGKIVLTIDPGELPQ